MKARLKGSLVAGVIVAIFLVAFADQFRHAALSASAARSGAHQTVTSILASGFIGTTLIVTVVVFVLATVAAGRRKTGATTAAPQRRRAGAGR